MSTWPSSLTLALVSLRSLKLLAELSPQTRLPELELISHLRSTVGDNDVGTDTLEVAKQFWRIVPCGGDSSSSDSSSGVADTSSNVKLNVVASSDDNNYAATASFSSANSQATPTATSSDSASEDDSSSGYDLDAGFTPQATQEVVKSDRRTWTCQHSG